MRTPVIPSSVLLLALCLGPACGDKSDDTGEPPEETDVDLHRGLIDADDDGLADGEDCDDLDPSVGELTTRYVDNDSDGYGDVEVTVLACHEPPGFTADGGDCDDDDHFVNPGEDEWCDGEDDDCDGEVDEEPQNGEVYYYDNDGDGFGDPEASIVACERPDGTVEDDTDCDDDDLP